MNDIKYVVNFAQDVHSTEYGSSCHQIVPSWNVKHSVSQLHYNPCGTSSKVVTCICTAEKMEKMGTILQFDITCVSTMCG